MDNISKTKNERCKCDYCSISDIYSFITNYYFKLLINVSKNTAKKHYNIIFSNSHKKIHNIFEFERNIGI
jgi:hypothetical protein